MQLSPLAPDSFPYLPPVRGVELATYAAGLKYEGRADLMMAAVPAGTVAAGTLTQSLCPAAPVDWCRRVLQSGAARAVVCNAGNANAFTGRAGETAAELTAETIAASIGVEANEVLLASTGVIGETLPEAALADALPRLASSLAPSDSPGWLAAADAIRTTDTFAKGASSPIGDTGANVVGIAKGSGMIAPDMATMLAFVFTDVEIDQPALAKATLGAVQQSFNRITVDSDTSTSDTVLTLATGMSRVNGHEVLSDLQDALDSVMLSLAHQIVRDGEGATKFVEVAVSGAADEEAAKTIALSIGNSPLVKTAIAAEDANWGRIVMAVGKAGEAANRDALKIWIGEELVADDGVRAAGYDEERATAHLRGADVRIAVDVGVGSGSASIWTCDLTHGYIEINAGYRT